MNMPYCFRNGQAACAEGANQPLSPRMPATPSEMAFLRFMRGMVLGFRLAFSSFNDWQKYRSHIFSLNVNFDATTVGTARRQRRKFVDNFVRNFQSSRTLMACVTVVIQTLHCHFALRCASACEPSTDAAFCFAAVRASMAAGSGDLSTPRIDVPSAGDIGRIGAAHFYCE